MPEKIYVLYRRDDGYIGDCIDGQLEPCEGYNDTYHHDRILKAKDARIAELEAILQARGE